MDAYGSDKYILKKFGISLSVVLLLATLLIFMKSGRFVWPTFLLSFIFFVAALVKPFLLKPIHAVFMRLGLIVNWFISRLVLFVIFYVVFTPIGLIIRLLGIDLLDKKIDRRKESYWKKKEKNTLGVSAYEKQF